MSVTPPSPPKKTVVLCFCAKDQDGKAELVAHLATVSGALSWWSVAEVSGGQSVRAEFQRVVASADATLLLLSSDFFAALNAPGSADTNALPLAEQVELLRQQQPRGLQLIPLVWRDCEWREVEWLATLQPLPIEGTAIRGMDAAFAFTIAAEQSELVLLRADLPAAPGSKRKYKPQELHVNLGSTKLDIVLEDNR